jgi:hypothetical protein
VGVLLVKQLTLEFGELPDVYRTRLEASTTEALERYAERLLAAHTLAAVFAN